MKRLFLISFIVFLLVLGSTSQIMAQETVEQDQETFIIIFDESHYQYFNSDMMSTALSSLNTSLDTPALDVTISLFIQEDEFNTTNIQGADLVIMTNPGEDDEGDLPIVSTFERDALENLINIGSSVLWMSNPLAHNQNVTGHADPMNDLIFRSFGATVSTGVADSDNTTVIKDDLDFINNNSYVMLSSSNFNDPTLVTEYNDFDSAEDNSLVLYSAHIEETSGLPGVISANTSKTAYVLNNEFSYREYQQSPRWFYGKDFTGNDGGRGVLMGSSVMFSEMMFEGSTKWVDQGNNLELFQNMIGWLLQLTPVPELLAIVTEPYSFFVNFNIFFGLALTAGVAVVVIFRYVRQGRLSVSDLTKFRQSVSKTKRKTTAPTKADKPKAKKKAPKRKRN